MDPRAQAHIQEARAQTEVQARVEAKVEAEVEAKVETKAPPQVGSRWPRQCKSSIKLDMEIDSFQEQADIQTLVFERETNVEAKVEAKVQAN